MRITTPLNDLLNIKYPIIQGAMAWIADGNLVAAVSSAGGLGIIGAGGASLEWIEKQIDIVQAATSNPFGVNLMLADSNIDEIVQLVIAKKVPVVTTGAGNPGKYMESLKAAQVKIIPVVASVALARRLERLGADALIVEGMESGGHIGEMTTMCLLPMVADAVSVPLIAAGGIADGRGFIAALALGAAGIQVGTRFICANECPVHADYKAKVIKAKDRDTVVCGSTTGHPVRAIQNKFTRNYLQQERNGATPETLSALGKGRYPAATNNGEIDEGSVLAGQICGLVNKIEPAADILLSIMQDAIKIKQQLGGMPCPE